MASSNRQQDVLEEEAGTQPPAVSAAEEVPSEQTPLLPRRGSDTDSASRPKTARRRWPSLVALLLLLVAVVLVMVLAFVAPDVAKEYAEKAVVFEPQSLSIDSFTSTGVRARVQGSFRMDASRVEKQSVRNLGRFFTYVAREVETGESDVEVSLPEYGNVVLGVAHVPSIKVNIQNKRWNFIDFLADLEPGNIDGIRSIANDWIDGRLGRLRVLGKANVPLKSGIFAFGTQFIQHELTFANNDIPAMPAYDIKRLSIREVDIPSGKGMAADALISIQNDYPVEFTVPPLGFGVLVDGCSKSDQQIMVADALTKEIYVKPKARIDVAVTGTVRRLPDVLIQDCPNTNKSPLDILLGQYIRGNDTTIYVQGSDSPSPDTPRWIPKLISSLTVPVPIPGHDALGHLIRNFSPTDTHFGLPDPWAEPDTPESKPRISAKVQALVALPEEMNFNLSVSRVRANADVLYNGAKFGELDLHKWQPANSSRVEVPPHRKHPKNGKPSKDKEEDDSGPMLRIESFVEEAPLTITDEDGFTDVIEQLIFGKQVNMTIKAKVDVEVDTVLGNFVVRSIPATGRVPVKPLPISPHPPNKDPSRPPDGRDPPSAPPLNSSLLHPKLTSLRLLASTKQSLTLEVILNVTNPTEYSATIPYLDLQLVKNASLLGHGAVRNMNLTTGRNGGLIAVGTYEPESGDAREEGRKLLSAFVSGRTDISLGIRGHANSFIPPAEEREDISLVRRAPREDEASWTSLSSSPATAVEVLGRVLERLGTFEVQLPRIDPPTRDPSDPDDGGDDDDDREEPPRFIKDATFHLLSSTATFRLLNPLPHDEIWIMWLDATALYPRPAPSPPDEDPEDPDDPDDDPWSATFDPWASAYSTADNNTVLEPVGRILYFDHPFSIPPISETPDGEGALTPKLPVDWSLGSVGYDAVRKALGGKLKLGARAKVGVRIGKFEETVDFEKNGGIGAGIRL